MSVDKKIIKEFREAQSMITNTIDKELELLGVNNSEMLILKFLKNVRECKVQELGEIAEITSGAITYHINRLINKKMIVKEQSRDDKRIFYLQITEYGKEKIKEVMKTYDDYVEYLFSKFSKKEKNNYHKMLKLFNEKLMKREDKYRAKHEE
jgi:MarR family 2-MHQ and catechol resistance regulon transcriptional repressor